MAAVQNNTADRLSINESASHAEMKINGKIDRWKEALLLAWVLAWIFCGLAVLIELLNSVDRDMKLMLIVFLVFWAYYLWKIGTTLVYRIRGYELIKIANGEIHLSRNILGAGKVSKFFIANIKSINKVEIPKRSFAFTYENQWWIIGGEKLGFEYGEKFIRFGMQLSEKETQDVLRFLKKSMAKHRESRR